jgi:predicted permease
MAWMARFRNLFRQEEAGREIDEELAAHIAMRTEDNVRAGMAPGPARRDALLRFGNRAATGERVMAADAALGAATLTREVRYALRRLRRSPGFALTVAVTLALGIGANVVVLGVVNAVLLRPLDVPDPARLYNVVHGDPGNDNQSYPDYLDYRARNHTFTDMAVYRYTQLSLLTGGRAEGLFAGEVSGNFFALLGVRPALGRLFAESDEHGPNSAPYLVLSYGYWKSRFHADPAVVGRTVEVDRHPFTILGVAPPGFHGVELPLWPEVWLPIVNEQQVESFDLLTRRYSHGSWILGRLRPGVTEQQAEQDLNAAAREMARLYPHEDAKLQARLVKPGLFGDSIGDPARRFLTGVLALSLLVLLAACANLAAIFAARAMERSRELAIRLAIGSGRGRVMKELLIEALLVSLGGGAIGTGGAALLLHGLAGWQPAPGLPLRVAVTADARVWAAAAALTLASGLFFGLLPARRVWRTSPAEVIKGGAAPAAERRWSLRDALLGLQVALCTLLLTACFVAVRGMQASLQAPLGFHPAGRMLLRTDLSMAGYSDATALAVKRELLARVRRLPGVQSAGLANTLPLSQIGGSNAAYYPEHTPDLDHPAFRLVARYYSIDPGYLEAAGTRLLAGRNVSWEDTPKTLPVALVNDTFARRFFGSAQAALGRRFLVGHSHAIETVAGVVEDGRYETLNEDAAGAVFYPVSQTPDTATVVVVHSLLPAQVLAGQLRGAAAAVDSGLPVEVMPWSADLAAVFLPARVASLTLGVMGVLAAMLAVTGVFGMAAYSVSRRMRELGIRVALGADRSRLMRSALGRPLGLLLGGSIAGLAAGIGATRLLAAIVYQATPRDPLVLGGVAACMAILGLVATWMPARRALAVDPAQLLRTE